MTHTRRSRPSKKLAWYLPTDLIDWVRERAEVKGMSEGEYLTYLLDQIRARSIGRK